MKKKGRFGKKSRWKMTLAMVLAVVVAAGYISVNSVETGYAFSEEEEAQNGAVREAAEFVAMAASDYEEPSADVPEIVEETVSDVSAGVVEVVEEEAWGEEVIPVIEAEEESVPVYGEEDEYIPAEDPEEYIYQEETTADTPETEENELVTLSDGMSVDEAGYGDAYEAGEPEADLNDSEAYAAYREAMQAVYEQILALGDAEGAEELWNSLMEIWDEIYAGLDDGTLILSDEEMDALNALTEEILAYLQDELGYDPYETAEAAAIDGIDGVYYMQIGDTATINASGPPTQITFENENSPVYAEISYTGSGSNYTITVTATANGAFGIRAGDDVYTFLVGDQAKVYVYVASRESYEGPTFSDRMFEILGIDTDSLDANLYFPAGEIVLEDSFFYGKESSINSYGLALITSEDDWGTLFSLLSNMDTTTLTGTAINNRGNRVGEFMEYAGLDVGYSSGSQHSALFRWGTDDTIPWSSYGFDDQGVIFHLDLRFEIADIEYVYGNNNITDGVGKDGDVAVDWETYIKGVTVKETESEFGIPEGYMFAGYYMDADFTEQWDGTAVLDQDETIIYIRLIPIVPPTKTVDVGDGINVQVGKTLSYTISYQNNSSEESTVTITDVLDDGLDFVSASDGGIYDEGTHTVTWTISADAYESGSVTVSVTVNEDALEADEVTNTASVQVGDDPAVETNPVENPVEDPEDPTKDVNVGNGSEVQVDDTLIYTITYKNGHNTEATVTITDILDDGLDFVSATDDGFYDEETHTVTWVIEDVAAYTEGSVELTVTVNSDAVVKEEVDNTAFVQVGIDPVVETNPVENPLDDPEDPEKSVNVEEGTEVSVGEELVYTITYKNDHSTASTVVITDPLDVGVDFVSASNGGEYDEATHTVTWTLENVAGYAEGNVTLIVRVNENALMTGEDENPEIENTASVQVGNDPAVETNPVENPVEDPEDPTKDVDAGNGNEVQVDDTLTYTITYKNGHSTEATVTITDILDAGLDFVSASDDGFYDEETRTVIWVIEDVGAYTEGSVELTVTVNSDAVVKEEVDNTATVQVGDDPAVETNPVENPLDDPEDPTKGVDVGDGSEVKVGDELTYVITYKNDHSTASTITITDVLDDGLDFVGASDGGTYDGALRAVTWIIEDVEAYGTGSVTLTVTVNENALETDEVTNTAFVQVGPNETVETNTVENPVDDSEAPEKSVDVGDGTEVSVGDELTYTIEYKNGHSEAADVTITDVLDDGLTFISAEPEGTYAVSEDADGHTVITWTIENVEAHAEGSVTFTAAVNENALEKDEVENTASVKVGENDAVDTNPVENPVYHPEDPDKSANVAPDTDVSVGDSIVYTIEYKNGHSTAADITITDTLEEDLDFVYALNGGTYDEETRTVTWTIENVEPYAEGYVTLVVQVNENALVTDEVNNTASVQIENDAEVDAEADPIPVYDPEDPTKDVDVGDGTEVKVDDELTYTITYKNGYSTAADVIITDVLDDGLTFVTAAPEGTYAVSEDADGHTVITWTIENVEAYGEGSVTLTVKVNEDALETDEVTNTAAVQIGNDPAVETNEVENPVEDLEDPEKSVDVGEGAEVSVGDELVYSISYKNGHSAASTVTITDVLDAGLTFVSAEPEGTYAVSEDADGHTVITWTIENVAAYGEGSVTLTVEVNEDALETDEVTNTASVQIGNDPAVDTNEVENPVDDPEDPEKSVNVEEGTEVSVGEELVYTIAYKNDHSTASTVVITDPLDVGVDFVSASNGGVYDSATHTVTWTIENVAGYAEGNVTLIVRVNENALTTAEDEGPKIENTASVQVGNDPAVETNPVENPVEDPEDPMKDVNVGEGTEVSVDDTLTYTITYKNGHSTEATVTITDILDAGLDFVSASDDGFYDEETRTVIWVLEDVAAYTEGSVDLTVTVNSDAVVKEEVDNTAFVQIGDDPVVETNPVENPLDDPEDPTKGVDVGDGSEVKVGDELYYVITYKNDHSTASTITITDVLDDGLDFVSATDGGTYDGASRTVTWIIDDVAAYGTGRVTLTVIVNEDALETDEVTNTASVQVGTNEAVDTNTVENPVDDSETPEKSVDVGDGTEVSVGDELTYTIEYKNGHSEAADIIITDVLDDGLTFVSATPEGTYVESTDSDGHTVITWTIGNVAAHAEGSVTFTAVVNENALEKDEVENTASVKVGENDAVDTNPVENPVYHPEDPDKTANVEPDTDVNVGDSIIYTIEYKNGHSTAADITITDTLEEGLDFVYALNGGTYDEETRTVTWTIENVEPYAEGYVTLVVQVNENALVEDEVNNTASVEVDNDGTVTTEPVTIPVYDPEDPTKDVDVGDGTEVKVDDELTYTITYKNGYSTAADVIITDVLDDGLTFVTAAPEGTYAVSEDADGHTVITWTIENVAAYGEGSVSLIVTVNENALETDEVTNTAYVQIGNDAAQDTNTIENPVEHPEDPTKDVDVGDGEDVKTGDELTYTITYKNGHSTAADVTITDPLDVGVDFVDASDGGSYNESTHTVTWTIEGVEPYGEGSVELTVAVNENAFDQNNVSNTASVQIGNDPAVDTNEINNPVEEFFPLDEEIVNNESDRSTWVKSESVNEYNAIEIEMSTYLPIIQGEKVQNGDYVLTFHNMLSSELILDELDTDFAVYIGGRKISEDYYTVILSSSTAWFSLRKDSLDDECTFHVDVDLTALYQDGVITDEDLKGDTEIMITFYTDLEGTGLNGSYTSTVWYEVYDGDELQYISPQDVVEVYTYEIELVKYDAAALADEDYEGAALAGATMALYTDESCTEPVRRYGEPYTIVSGTDGYAIFYGLAEGTYYVKETVAPEGYVRSDEVVTVVLGQDLNDSGHAYYGVFANEPEPEPVPGTPQDPTKSVNVGENAKVMVDDELTYTITYYNYTEETAEVTITDELDPLLDFVEVSDRGSYDEDTHTVTWNLRVPAGTEGAVTLTAKVNSAAKVGDVLENTASVKVGEETAVDTNTVENPVDEPTSTKDSPYSGTTGTTSSGTGRVKTGDMSNLLLWIMMIACAAVVADASWVRSRKKRERSVK